MRANGRAKPAATLPTAPEHVARVAVEADVSHCCDCGKILTADEAYWYSYRCDECEGDWAERMENYRHGVDDPMLDLLFSG